EPEPEAAEEDFVTPQSFRDYRRGSKGVATSAPGATSTAAAAPALVPDIPRDITPEELDALSALAAKLDGQGASATDNAEASVQTASSETAMPSFEVKASE